MLWVLNQKWGENPQNGWFIWKSLLKWMFWGVPPFSETPLCSTLKFYIPRRRWRGDSRHGTMKTISHRIHVCYVYLPFTINIYMLANIPYMDHGFVKNKLDPTTMGSLNDDLRLPSPKSSTRQAKALDEMRQQGTLATETSLETGKKLVKCLRFRAWWYFDQPNF